MSGKLRPVRAWCIAKGGRLLPNEVYTDKDIVLAEGEKLVRVIISCEKAK